MFCELVCLLPVFCSRLTSLSWDYDNTGKKFFNFVAAFLFQVFIFCRSAVAWRAELPSRAKDKKTLEAS